jgi:Tol biopolymer transport system component
VILYEMATGRRPFTGDTSISIISSIVKDTPVSVTDINPALPRDLGRIIRRALSKDVERRYQTAKDLRNDLEELKASLDSGELQTSAMASGAITVGPTKPARHRGLLMFGAVLVISLAAVVVYQMTRGAEPAASMPDLEMTQLTTSGIATRPAISPDGKYVAYVQQLALQGPGGTLVPAASVWVRQVATSSVAQIIAPEPLARIGGLTISPDGSYVDYIKDGGGLDHGSLWRVSLLGGTPKKLVDGINTPIGWSADGRHMAFVRDRAGEGVSELIIADADGGNARVLATRKSPAEFVTLLLANRPSIRPAWSPDGRLIAVAGALLVPTVQGQIVFVDSTTGAEDARRIDTKASSKEGLEWLDAGSLVVNRTVAGGTPQLWRVTYPTGELARLTNDLTSYIGVSMTAARDSLVTTRTDRRVAIWISGGSGANAREVVPATQSGGARDALAWSADRLLFTSTIDGRRSISSIGLDGGTPQDAVPQGDTPIATSDGRTVVYRSTDPSRPGLWKVTDGARAVELVGGQGNWPRVTRDDRSVVFVSTREGLQSLWMVSIDGGTPAQVSNRFASYPILSPDGKNVAFTSFDGQGRPATAICRLDDCSSPRFVAVLATGGSGRRFAWTPDSAGFLYAAGTPENLWVESLDGKPPRQLTHFTDDRQIADADFSRDGTRLAIARSTTISDVLLIKGLKR